MRLYRGNAYQRYRDFSQQALTATLNTLFPGALDGHNEEMLTEVLLAHLVESSPPHSDAVEFLEWAQRHYPLIPITNMDNDLWQRSQLVRYFEHVTTAEMAKAYKPSQAIFSLALDRLGRPAQNVMHCSLASWAEHRRRETAWHAGRMDQPFIGPAGHVAAASGFRIRNIVASTGRVTSTAIRSFGELT